MFLKFSVLVINLRQLLSFEGEGDKGGEVSKQSLYENFTWRDRFLG